MAESRTDAELLLAWRGGDTTAGSALVERHFAAVARYFARRLDEAAAADVLQQTFEACLHATDQIPREVGFRAYLFGIARNQLLMYWRAAARARDRIDAIDPEAMLAQSTMGPASRAIAHEQLRALVIALRELPPDLQAVIELSYWEDLTQIEIAAVLQIPEGTVKSRLSRARQRLQARVEALGSDPALAEVTVRDLAKWARSAAGRRP